MFYTYQTRDTQANNTLLMTKINFATGKYSESVVWQTI